MKTKLLAMSMMTLLAAPAAMAQSGNPNYPLVVQGPSGFTFFCRPNPVNPNTLSCIDPAVQRVVQPQATGIGGLTTGGGGVLLGIGALALLGIVAMSDDNSASSASGT